MYPACLQAAACVMLSGAAAMVVSTVGAKEDKVIVVEL